MLQTVSSDAAVAWPAGAKSSDPRVQGWAPELQAKDVLEYFSVTVKISTSRYQTLECFIATLPTWGVYGRLVHVAETINRFADVGL